MASPITALKFHSTKADGTDNAGGKVYTYAAGTTTPQVTYQDAAGLIPNANPVILDGTGRAFIYIVSSLAYKFVCQDFLGATVPDGTVDNVTDTGGTLALNLSSTTDATKGAGMVGYGGPQLAYAANTVGYKLKERRSICDAPYDCRPDGDVAAGTGTDWTTQIQQAINDSVAAGDRSLFIPPGVFKCGQVTIPSEFTLYGAGNYISILFCVNAFNSDGLLKLNGAGGPPTSVHDLGILAQNGGAGAASIGINSLANGVFLRDLWVSGFKTNVVLGSSDNFLTNSAIEETATSGTGVSIISTDVSVSGCVLYNCYIGLSVTGVAYLDGVVNVSNVRSVACGYEGFLLSNSSNIQLLGCSAGHNNLTRYGNAGLMIDTCTDVTVTDFVGRLGGGPSTTSDGIRVNNSSNVEINSPKLRSWRDGVSISGGSDCVVIGGICNDNYRRGVYLTGGDGLKALGVNCRNNGSVAGTTDAGVYSDNTAGFSMHMIVGCITTQNGGGPQDYGIYANLTDNGTNSGTTIVTGNTSQFNSGVDIALAGKTENIKFENNVAGSTTAPLPVVASAATITPPIGASEFQVSGTTNITSIAAAGGGRRTIKLIFQGALTVTDGSNLKLNGNFVTTADDVLTLVGDGTNWYEVARSAN